MNRIQKSQQPIHFTDLNRKALNLGVIGLGQWGRNVLLPKLKSFRSSKSLGKVGEIYLHDVNQEEISEIDHTGKVTFLSCFEDVVNHSDIDGLIVATPDDSHYEITKQALTAGKHVFVEKSFVRNAEQARELVYLAEKNNRQLMVGYEYMFDKRFAALAKLLDSGKLGGVTEISLHLVNKYVPEASKPWGNATIVEHHSCHQFSILQLLLGNHLPEGVRIHEALEGYVRASMRYRGINVNFTTAVNYPSQDNYRHITIKGSRLTVSLDFSGNDVVFRLKFTQNNETVDPADSAYPEELSGLGGVDSVEDELLYFHKLVNESVPNVSGGQTAIHMLELVALINAHYLIHRSKTDALNSEASQRYMASLNAAIDDVYKHDDLPEQRKNELRALCLNVVALLRSKPYLHAKEVSRLVGVDVAQLKLIYKTIQSSKEAQRALRSDSSFDYFDVVDGFFSQQQYEATFFVGVVCPYKCTFCKMQMTALPVHQDTPRFEYRKLDLLDLQTISTTVRQLARLHQSGKKVSVKISGGLEPLTDMKRVSAIAKGAISQGLPVKLYTNGTLINSQEKRDLLLQFSDVRISLNAINEEKYRKIYLDDSDGKKSKTSLSKLVGLIESLIQDKKLYKSKTRIGLNFVVIKETIEDMEAMAYLAERMGLDYINYNIDYFDHFSDREYIAIRENIKTLKQSVAEGKLGSLHVNFGGSLLRDNVFTNKPLGDFNPTDIRKYKVFVDPAGYVTPLHEGTFAYRDPGNASSVNPFVLGRLGEQLNFDDLMSSEISTSNIGYEYLAPLELILALEMIRLKEDEKLGLSVNYSPYYMAMDACS